MEITHEIMNMMGIAFATMVVLLGATKFANGRVKSLYDANHELVEKNNMALSFRRMGMMIGVSLAMSGILVNLHTDLVSILSTLRDAVFGSLFIFISFKIADKITIHNVNNDVEIKNNNIAVGIVEFGILVATGLIAYGSFKGEGIWYSSIVYFVLGQIILILLAKGYSKYIVKIKTLDKNIASAVLISSVMISLSLIIMAAIMGDFTTWTQDLTSFAKWTFIGLLTLIVFSNSIVDKLLLPTSSIEQEIKDENYAAMAFIGAFKIGMSIVIVGFVA